MIRGSTWDGSQMVMSSTPLRGHLVHLSHKNCINNLWARRLFIHTCSSWSRHIYLSIYLWMNDIKMMKIIRLQVINNTPCYRDCWDLIHWTEDIQPLKWRGWLHMTRHRPLDHHNPCHQEPVHSHCITLQVSIKYTIRSNEMIWVDCGLHLVGDQYHIQASLFWIYFLVLFLL